MARAGVANAGSARRSLMRRPSKYVARSSSSDARYCSPVSMSGAPRRVSRDDRGDLRGGSRVGEVRHVGGGVAGLGVAHAGLEGLERREVQVRDCVIRLALEPLVDLDPLETVEALETDLLVFGAVVLHVEGGPVADRVQDRQFVHGAPKKRLCDPQRIRGTVARARRHDTYSPAHLDT